MNRKIYHFIFTLLYKRGKIQKQSFQAELDKHYYRSYHDKMFLELTFQLRIKFENC